MDIEPINTEALLIAINNLPRSEMEDLRKSYLESSHYKALCQMVKAKKAISHLERLCYIFGCGGLPNIPCEFFEIDIRDELNTLKKTHSGLTRCIAAFEILHLSHPDKETYFTLGDTRFQKVLDLTHNAAFVYLSYLDLRHLNIGTLDFSKANLSYANLTGATIDDGMDLVNMNTVDFHYANMQGIDFYVSLKNEHFYYNLKGANLSSVNFDNAKLYRLNLEGANLSNASFRNTCIVESNLLDAQIEGADFSRDNELKGLFSRNQLLGTEPLTLEILQDKFHNLLSQADKTKSSHFIFDAICKEVALKVRNDGHDDSYKSTMIQFVIGEFELLYKNKKYPNNDIFRPDLNSLRGMRILYAMRDKYKQQAQKRSG